MHVVFLRSDAFPRTSTVQAVKQQISTMVAEQALTREVLDQALGDRGRASPRFTQGVSAFHHKRQPDYS